MGAAFRYWGSLVLCLLPLAAAAVETDCDAATAWRVLHADAAPPPARAVWLDARRLRWPGHGADGRYRLLAAPRGGLVAVPGRRPRGAERELVLDVVAAPQPPPRWPPPGVTLALRAADAAALPALLRGELLLVEEDARGRVRDASGTQAALALDALYADAARAIPLGPQVSAQASTLALWAPSAQAVALCLHADAAAAARRPLPLRRDEASGVWRLRLDGDQRGRYYTFLVDVYVPGTGLVRQRVTDPYALSLSADSARAWLGDLDDPAVQPPGWAAAPRPPAAAALTDQIIYELHLRDFSAGDATVPAPHRGKYLAFTDADSAGMRHLRALAAAGLSDVHLMPVFDFAAVPERGCVSPAVAGAPDGEAQQAAVAAVRTRDCYHWGYEPLHFGAPEGSYASDADDGAVRVREFRAMVQALHALGLRVGMDVVYNHTHAAGQQAGSVLDRIVPGYYHRLDAEGRVATSTCCANTATEHALMARLMTDTAVRWVRDYRVDAFRFDLMGHQPLAAMQALHAAVDRAAGRPIALLGEGWNFGEVADGARFVQATQAELAGSGIASFSDRARDALRGGGAGDAGAALRANQGWLNGLALAPNDATRGRDARAALRHAAELLRVGLAGTLRTFRGRDAADDARTLAQLDYAGQPAGYAAQPGEVVNYVENHDGLTLYDLDALRLPRDTSTAERARVQLLAAATVLLSQGIAYFDAGFDLLRSKSLDRNSVDAGDAFNAIDWTGVDNGFGRGLPPAADNGADWPLLRPLLADPALKPAPADIAWMRAAFRDLLRLRARTGLLRLRSADEVQRRLRFIDVGALRDAGLVAAHLDGTDYADAGAREVLYLLNPDLHAHTLRLPQQRARAWQLHPVQRAPQAADARVREGARYGASDGSFRVPARSAAVFVIE